MQTLPFSRCAKGLVLERLPDGFGYGFNFSDPAGVKLIPPSLFDRIKSGYDLTTPSGDLDSFRANFPDLFRNPRAAPQSDRLSVWLHVVNACNFACHYCYVPHLRRFVDPKTIERHSLDPTKFSSLLNNLVGYCQENGLTELHVTFAGGEPTLNLPLVDEFCRQAEEVDGPIRITFGMISNGSFTSDALLPLLRRYHMRISLSVDGFAESHDRIRFELDEGIKIGSWSTLLRNVDALLENAIQPYFLYTVTQGNFRDLGRFAAYAHGKGLGFRLSLVRTKQLVSRDDQEEIAQELVRFYGEMAESLSTRLPIPRNAAFAEWDLYRKKYVPCSSCRNYFAVDADGGVASCQMRMDETYGNAGAEPFGQIVAKMQAASSTQTLSKPAKRHGACVECEYFHVCGGGCPQHTALALGSMDQPSPWCWVFGSVIPHYIRAVARQLQRAVQSAQA